MTTPTETTWHPTDDGNSKLEGHEIYIIYPHPSGNASFDLYNQGCLVNKHARLWDARAAGLLLASQLPPATRKGWTLNPKSGFVLDGYEIHIPHNPEPKGPYIIYYYGEPGQSIFRDLEPAQEYVERQVAAIEQPGTPSPAPVSVQRAGHHHRDVDVVAAGLNSARTALMQDRVKLGRTQYQSTLSHIDQALLSYTFAPQ